MLASNEIWTRTFSLCGSEHPIQIERWLLYAGRRLQYDVDFKLHWKSVSVLKWTLKFTETESWRTFASGSQPSLKLKGCPFPSEEWHPPSWCRCMIHEHNVHLNGCLLKNNCAFSRILGVGKWSYIGNKFAFRLLIEALSCNVASVLTLPKLTGFIHQATVLRRGPDIFQRGASVAVEMPLASRLRGHIGSRRRILS